MTAKIEYLYSQLKQNNIVFFKTFIRLSISRVHKRYLPFMANYHFFREDKLRHAKTDNTIKSYTLIQCLNQKMLKIRMICNLLLPKKTFIKL